VLHDGTRPPAGDPRGSLRDLSLEATCVVSAATTGSAVDTGMTQVFLSPMAKRTAIYSRYNQRHTTLGLRHWQTLWSLLRQNRNIDQFDRATSAFERQTVDRSVSSLRADSNLAESRLKFPL